MSPFPTPNDVTASLQVTKLCHFANVQYQPFVQGARADAKA